MNGKQKPMRRLGKRGRPDLRYHSRICNETLCTQRQVKPMAIRSRLEHALKTEGHLVAAVIALGATSVKTLSSTEDKMCRKGALSYDSATRTWLKQYIAKGNDPLGDAFCRLQRIEIGRAHV